MIYADADGQIGKAMAVHPAKRNPHGDASLLRPAQPAGAWEPTVRGPNLLTDHRANRLWEQLAQSDRSDLAQLASLRQDVWMPAAVPVRDRLVVLLRDTPPKAAVRFADALTGWDGRYKAGSSGALALELLLNWLRQGEYVLRPLRVKQAREHLPFLSEPPP